MSSIYTNIEVQYTNYLSVANFFDPSCGNYFVRVEQEKFFLSSSAMFSQLTTMQQVIPINDLYEVTYMVRPITLDIFMLRELLGQRSHPLVIKYRVQ
jgi:hypothetical protein